MPKYELTGGCHCGNIGCVVSLSKAPQTLRTVVCECSFCKKHGAVYLADNQGNLSFSVNDRAALSKYRQGDSLAEFLVCRECGVLVGSVYVDGDQAWGVVNVNAVDQQPEFADVIRLKPGAVDKKDKIDRWKNYWFSGVSL